MHTDMCTTDFICRKERRICDVHSRNFCLAWIQSALNLCFSIHMILESVMWIMRGWAALQSDRCAFALLIEAFPLLSCQPIAVVFIISRIFFRDSSTGLSNMCTPSTFDSHARANKEFQGVSLLKHHHRMWTVHSLWELSNESHISNFFNICCLKTFWTGFNLGILR